MAKDKGGVEKKVEKKIEEDTANKISLEEFAVNCPADKLWIGGLKVYAGSEPRTMEKWKKDLEEFKNKPV